MRPSVALRVTNKSLLVCLFVALILRLAFVFLGFPHLRQRWNLREDGDGYGVIAQSIREGHYDDVTRGPIYPCLVAAAGSPLAVKVLQALLDTATCLLVFWLARLTLHAPRSTPDAPVWAAALWAVYPFAIWRVAFINKEIVLTFLLTGYVCLQLLALRDGKVWQWLAAGGLLGLVNLCKPVFLPWPLMVFAFVWLNRVSVCRFLLLVVALGAVVGCWTVRNFKVTEGEFLPVATEQGGVTTFVGNYQPTLGLWEGPAKIKWMAAVEEIKLQHGGASTIQLDRAFYRAAWAQMTAHPLKAAELFVRKCGRFWLFSAARRERLGSVLIQAAYLSLAGVALWRLRPWRMEVVVILALMAYVMLVHALSYADLRFSLPVMPYVCALGARALARR